MKKINGKQLRKIREKAGLSQRQMADRIGVNRNSIAWSEYKHPMRKIPVALQERVETVFDLENGEIKYDTLCKPVVTVKKSWIRKILDFIIRK